jgi:HSP20 family molecular chaperone IbpA
MLLPRIFENNFVDNFFNDVFTFPFTYSKPADKWMNTNVKDLGNDYQLEIELPGFEKKDIHAQLEKGYLTISADRQESKEENDDKGRYIHREHYSGSCRRSFYVGDDLKEDDFHASFDNGVLKLVFPKDKIEAKLEQKKYIAIE